MKRQGITEASGWRGSSGWKHERLQNGITGSWVMNPHLVIRKDKIYQRHCPKTDREKDKQCWRHILDGRVKWEAISGSPPSFDLWEVQVAQKHQSLLSVAPPLISAVGASGLVSKTPNDPKRFNVCPSSNLLRGLLAPLIQGQVSSPIIQNKMKNCPGPPWMFSTRHLAGASLKWPPQNHNYLAIPPKEADQMKLYFSDRN